MYTVQDGNYRITGPDVPVPNTDVSIGVNPRKGGTMFKAPSLQFRNGAFKIGKQEYWTADPSRAAMTGEGWSLLPVSHEGTKSTDWVALTVDTEGPDGETKQVHTVTTIAYAQSIEVGMLALMDAAAACTQEERNLKARAASDALYVRDVAALEGYRTVIGEEAFQKGVEASKIKHGIVTPS